MKILLSHASRFLGWWLGLGALYASTGGSCPCCGSPGCPVGFSGAGLVGAAFALLMRQKSRLFNRSSGAPDSPGGSA